MLLHCPDLVTSHFWSTIISSLDLRVSNFVSFWLYLLYINYLVILRIIWLGLGLIIWLFSALNVIPFNDFDPIKIVTIYLRMG